MAWSDKQLAYMDWLNADPLDRIQRDEEELAEHLDITDRTLYNWRQLPGWDEARVKRANLTFHLKSPRILNAMMRSLTNPFNAKEQVQWFRYANMFNLRAMEAGTFNDVLDGAASTTKELSPAELQEKLSEIPEAARPYVLDFIHALNLLPPPEETREVKRYTVVKEITIPEPEYENPYKRTGRKRKVRTYQEPEETEE